MSARPQQLPDRLKDYVFVSERVQVFREEYMNGRIETEMITVNDNLICFKARIFCQPDDAQPSATGHAIDTIDLTKSTLEKTETAAVGRALAFLGYSTKRGLASQEELDKQERHNKPITVEQTATIRTLSTTEKGKPHVARCLNDFGVDRVGNLTEQQAAAIIRTQPK